MRDRDIRPTAPLAPRAGSDAWLTYMAASVPGWTVAIIASLVLNQIAGVPAWTAIVVVAVWILTDLAMFPRRRRYYLSEPPAARMLGEKGVAISDVSPRGLVRVRGELWQARAFRAETVIREGDRLIVRDVEGLELLVEPGRVEPRPGRAT